MVCELFFRANNQPSVRQALSEEAILRRERRGTINIQMTMLAWSLELISSILLFISVFAIFTKVDTHKESRYEKFWIVAFDASINCIVIPLAYILNLEDNKHQIVSNGWCKGLRSIVGCQSKAEEDMPDTSLPDVSLYQPIQSISHYINHPTAINLHQTISEVVNFFEQQSMLQCEHNVSYINNVHADEEQLPFAPPRHYESNVGPSSPTNEHNRSTEQFTLNAEELFATLSHHRTRGSIAWKIRTHREQAWLNSMEMSWPSVLADTYEEL